MLTAHSHLSQLLFQFDDMPGPHQYPQYIAWPKTLIFLGMDFVLPKRQYHFLLTNMANEYSHSLCQLPARYVPRLLEFLT